jgi:hypothetical protein
MSDAALDEDAPFSGDANQDQRFALLEREFTKHREDTHNMFAAIQTSLAAVNAAQTAAQSAKLPDPPKITPVVVPVKNRPRPSPPSDYDGDRAKGRDFLKSCTLYIRLCHADFVDDQAKILWVLSYMKTDRASDFANEALEYSDTTGRDLYKDWAAFYVALVENFLPPCEASIAVLRLESDRYYQGKRTVQEYLDEFKTLVRRSGYEEEIGIVLKFRRGLNREIHDKIAEMGTGRPKDNRPDLWYEAAKVLDQNRLANDVFHGTASRRQAGPAHATPPAPRAPFARFSSPLPPVAALPARTPLRSPFPNAPFAPPVRDANREKPTQLTCYRCNEPGHTSRECPRRIDVRFLTLNEREDLFQDLLAARDVVGNAEPTTVRTVTEETEEEEEVQPEGFAHRDG